MAYFAALGIGFMFLKMRFIQIFTRFLGDPVVAAGLYGTPGLLSLLLIRWIKTGAVDRDSDRIVGANSATRDETLLSTRQRRHLAGPRDERMTGKMPAPLCR